MENEERFRRIEDAVLMMKDLIVSHDERIDRNGETISQHDKKLADFFRALEESRKDFDFKMNALIAAQMQNEADISKLKAASESHLQRIVKLENE